MSPSISRLVDLYCVVYPPPTHPCQDRQIRSHSRIARHSYLFIQESSVIYPSTIIAPYRRPETPLTLVTMARYAPVPVLFATPGGYTPNTFMSCSASHRARWLQGVIVNHHLHPFTSSFIFTVEMNIFLEIEASYDGCITDQRYRRKLDYVMKHATHQFGIYNFCDISIRVYRIFCMSPWLIIPENGNQ